MIFVFSKDAKGHTHTHTLHWAKKNIFHEKKSTQNKPKWCLPNTSLNEINLNKKKITANQT
jgi:hypothetical protein